MQRRKGLSAIEEIYDKILRIKGGIHRLLKIRFGGEMG